MRAAREISAHLAREHVAVVSGMARGADTCAHEGALSGHGRTIAVLGCGADVVYPPENAELAERILDSGGALVSEYPPGTPPNPGHFPARNRIISGLCQGTLLVEGAKGSGAMITVNFALEQGRDVFAVPGSIYSPLSAMPNRLIVDGAKPAISAWEILDFYRWAEKPRDLPLTPPAVALDEEEKQIVLPLTEQELSFEELRNLTQFPPAKLNSHLTMLELRGIIVKVPGECIGPIWTGPTPFRSAPPLSAEEPALHAQEPNPEVSMANANKLVIVESPAKAKTIGKFLGRGYKVEASQGHVRDLPKSQLGVDVENGFDTYIYFTIRGRGEILSRIRKEARGASKIFLATDPDREGEAISWHLANVLGVDAASACRIEFHEVTAKAVKAAVKSPRAINMNLVDAQQARRVLDRLVGYKISPLLWQKVKKGLSAGRVQSVLYVYLFDRENEIEIFLPEEYWSIDAKFQIGAGTICARYTGMGGEKAELKSRADAEEALARCEGARFAVQAIKRSERRKFPAAPFTTSTCSRRRRASSASPRRDHADRPAALRGRGDRRRGLAGSGHLHPHRLHPHRRRGARGRARDDRRDLRRGLSA